MKAFVIILAALAASAPAEAAPTAAISGAWVRALPGNLPAAGYFTLRNTGTKPLMLTGAESPACGMAMLHKSDSSGGMAEMSDITQIAIAPGKSIAFAPGGYHIMCMAPSAGLKPGTMTRFTLRFADGSSLTAPFPVRNAAGR